MELVYRPVIGVALTLFAAMGWRVRTFGVENVPPRGPAVIASNHIGYLDFVFIGYAARNAGRLVRFMAKKETFDHPIAGPLMRGMKHIPVDRYVDPAAAIQAAAASLRRGEIVGMFPEGTISRSFVPRPGKTGAARMAMESEAPLLPAALWGSQRILTKGRAKNFERKLAIDVHIGRPLPYRSGDDPSAVTVRLTEAISDLVETAQRQYPQRPTDGRSAWWLPAHMGGAAPTVEEADAMRARELEARRRAGS